MKLRFLTASLTNEVTYNGKPQERAWMWTSELEFDLFVFVFFIHCVITCAFPLCFFNHVELLLHQPGTEKRNVRKCGCSSYHLDYPRTALNIVFSMGTQNYWE